MSLSNRKQFVVLSEGKRDYDFVKKFLEEFFGKRTADVKRSNTVVKGVGSGEQQVRNFFPKELSTLRKKGHRNSALVVITDGDRFTVEERRAQLIGSEFVLHSDRVLIVVPCRNLESWFAWIDGEHQNEQFDFKNRYRKAKPMKYGKKLASICREQRQINFPPSLDDARSGLLALTQLFS